MLGPIPIEAKTEEDDNASMKRTKRSNAFGAGLTIDRGIVPPDDITPIHSVVMVTAFCRDSSCLGYQLSNRIEISHSNSLIS